MFNQQRQIIKQIHKIQWLDFLNPGLQLKLRIVVYFDQLSGAACTQKLVKILFIFRCFLLISGVKSL